MKFYPDMVYDSQTLKDMKIIFPSSLNALASLYTFVLLVDGLQINYSKATDNNTNIVKKFLPVTTAIALKIKQGFLLINSVGCSYFVINLIGFCNITLLYYFLHLRMLPNFVRMFVFSLAYIFYQRGSILDTLNKIDWFRNNVNVQLVSSLIP